MSNENTLRKKIKLMTIWDPNTHTNQQQKQPNIESTGRLKTKFKYT